MTRCWPINGKFTSHQTEAYEALLGVQLDLIQFCNERPPLDILFQRMCRQLGKNLQQIGFGRDAKSCVERAQVLKFFLCYYKEIIFYSIYFWDSVS
jgi:Xaa-Pro aminopeptidase